VGDRPAGFAREGQAIFGLFSGHGSADGDGGDRSGCIGRQAGEDLPNFRDTARDLIESAFDN
jgi:hypothetical protein